MSPRITPPGLPAPYLLGAPAKFTTWRPAQERAVLRHMFGEKRFTVSALPTGTGKSLMYMATAAMTGERTCVCTSTKGLQNQLMSDFREIGLIDVRGANSYSCLALAEGQFGNPVSDSCDNGPCRNGVPCSRRQSGCLYYDALARARDAKLVVTNYAFWLYQQNHGKGIGEFDRLVLDEAHDAMEWLASYLSGEITKIEVSLLGADIPERGSKPKLVKKWADGLRRDCADRIQHLGEQLSSAVSGGGSAAVRELRKELKQLNALEDKFGILAEDLDDRWVLDWTPYSVKYAVVWPGSYAEAHLFRGTPKVDLVSATLQPKTAELLGIPADEMDFADYPSDFPAKNRLVIHVPTVRMSYRNTDADERKWLERVDEIIGARLDRKGIIHTVSYKRRDLLMNHSEHRDVLLSHTPQTTRSVFERFKQAAPPCVLVSPAATTGWDFPGAECEYQIILKIPFPDLSSPVMKERQKQDKDYGSYVAAQTMIQMVGRGMRSAEDRCETILLDDNARWFMSLKRGFFPQWFLEAYTTVREGRLPVPPALIGGEEVPF